MPTRRDLVGGKLLEILSLESLTMDEIVLKLKKSVGEVSVELSILQLRGDVVEREGRFFVNSAI